MIRAIIPAWGASRQPPCLSDRDHTGRYPDETLHLYRADVGLLASTAMADCGAGRVSIIGNDFPAIQAVAAGAAACAAGTTTNLTTET